MARRAEHGDPVELDAGGRAVAITSPDKVMFPKREETKLDLARYYLAVAEPLLRATRDRPVLLQRHPNGVRGKSFYQKRIPDSAPDWLQTMTVSTVNGTESRALVIADIAHVLWAVNMGSLGLHVWPIRAAAPDEADELRIDLDPSPGVTFDMVRETAAHIRDHLAEFDITVWPKTSGSKGLHLYVRVAPGWDSYDVRRAAIAIAREMELRHPDLVTEKWWKEERGTRVFVDYNQNAPHKNVFGAWCARPRVAAQVSTPFTWDELATIAPDDWTIATVPDRVASGGDPWEGIDDAPADITPLVQRWHDDLAKGIPDAPWPPVYPKQPDEAPRVAPSRARSED